MSSVDQLEGHAAIIRRGNSKTTSPQKSFLHRCLHKHGYTYFLLEANQKLNMLVSSMQEMREKQK